MSGGIIVYVIRNNTAAFYYAENSLWLIDAWYPQIKDLSYWQHIAQFKVDLSVLPVHFLQNNLPQLILNFDQKILTNNYYDQALEDHVPEDWQGIWIESVPEFLEMIPAPQRYWENIPPLI